MDEFHQNHVRDMIFKDYGISVHGLEQNRQRSFNGTNEGRTKFFQDTIRSGQRIDYSGNIVELAM
jgi:septum site-determining protein MinC